MEGRKGNTNNQQHARTNAALLEMAERSVINVKIKAGIFTEKGYFFSFKVRKNFRKYNEKRVDFSDHSRKIHKKGDI
jgi:hypothetical protein